MADYVREQVLEDAKAIVREQVLEDAKAIVMHDRNLDYGTPEQSFGKIAEMWEAYKGVPFTPHDVAVMLILLKVARISTSPGKLDHWVDIAGYAACGAEARPEERHVRT